MSPELATGVLVLGGTALFTAYAYHGPTIASGPLVESAEAAGAPRIFAGKALGGLAMAAASLLLVEVTGGSAAALFVPDAPFDALRIGAAALMPLFAVLAVASSGTQHQARYPEVRLQTWTYAQLAQSAGAWTLYLLGYELLFRGVLFLALAAQLGGMYAAIVSTALYVLAHLRKDAGETWSCFAMGALFCALASTGGVGAAIALHVAIAVSAELLSVWRNPNIRVVARQR